MPGKGEVSGRSPVTTGTAHSDHNDQTIDQLMKIVMKTLGDAKAEDLISIDLAGKSSIGDFMIIASGRSDRHVGAIAEQLLKAIRAAGFGRARVEGMPQCDWVVVDTGSVIIHVFRPEVRAFYDLEKMWQRPALVVNNN